MLKIFYHILGTLCVLSFTPEIMAHPGNHGNDGFILSWLHQLTSADHLLIALVFCLFIGLFISSVRRN